MGNLVTNSIWYGKSVQKMSNHFVIAMNKFADVQNFTQLTN